ncbi:hydrolase, alpha/beta fold family [Trichodelitschia bisporula]|uniref:alcohol O-acetyltransferase n=1 Tax=Trichodelitschia bisporula TaxID=703511 RepID=A0A6G1HN61_9PEZI|nr:hydrolase, alpha/beta fold family [Trichodelitschia bisporula]
MHLASYLGVARTTWYSHADPIAIPLKSQDDVKDEQTKVSLLDLSKQVTPPCRLNPLIFNGHVQTCWTAIKGLDIPITYKRRIFISNSTTYPGTFAVDFVGPTPETAPEPDVSLPQRTTYYTEDEFKLMGSDDDKPMLIMLHGLSGGSHEIYLRHVLRPLCLEDGGWEACVVNARGCAQSKITSGVLYNARATWDVRQMVDWCREKWPRRKLFGIGFSLGGNILTNYLGEEGAKCKLDAAVIVSNPWNLEVSNLALQRSWIGLHVYARVMGTGMKQLFEDHFEQITKGNPDIDIEKVRSARYLHEFDRYVQCPTWGWPTEGAYYRDASSVEPLLAIRIPVLAIHAEDDPIAVNEAVPHEEIKQSRHVVLCSTSLGGHLSWFEIGGERWFSRSACAFLQKMANEADLEALKKQREIPEPETTTSHKKPVVYDPIRRKLLIPDVA